MDIRRVDPELIIPAEASERGAKVALERHPADRRQQEKRRPPAAAPPATGAEEGEESASGVTPVYTQDGHVLDNEPAVAEVHYIDFSA